MLNIKCAKHQHVNIVIVSLFEHAQTGSQCHLYILTIVSATFMHQLL